MCFLRRSRFDLIPSFHTASTWSFLCLETLRLIAYWSSLMMVFMKLLWWAEADWWLLVWKNSHLLGMFEGQKWLEQSNPKLRDKTISLFFRDVPENHPHLWRCDDSFFHFSIFHADIHFSEAGCTVLNKQTLILQNRVCHFCGQKNLPNIPCDLTPGRNLFYFPAVITCSPCLSSAWSFVSLLITLQHLSQSGYDGWVRLSGGLDSDSVGRRWRRRRRRAPRNRI